jgi:DNA invertase Pin-like site-specific DNA recombinase
MNKNVAYMRVSTVNQTTQNQEFDIKNYCKSKGLDIPTKGNFISVNGISSSKSQKDRLINSTLEILNPGDILIVSKLDRLGRSTLDVLQTIDELRKKKVVLHIIKPHLEIDPLNPDPINNMYLTMLSSFAQMEREFISERTKLALARLKDEGVTLGRKPGAIIKSKYDDHKKDIEKYLLIGLSVVEILKLLPLKGTKQLLYSFMKKNGLKVMKK